MGLSAGAPAPFYVRIADEQTGRGVPLVELKTIQGLKFITDSAGIAAIDEPGFEGREVGFEITSHGYTGRQEAFRIETGKRRDLKLRRLMIAERLYRITGLGIYRDSVLAGLPAPIRNPLLNACVLGQDTASTALYRGRMFWIWGDTLETARFAGNATGATSALPGNGGLDPSAGIDLEYFTGKDGCAADLLPLPRKGLVWIEGLFTVKDPGGRERLLATYTRQDGLKPPLERGLAMFDDDRRVFLPLKDLPLSGHVSAHPFRHTVEGVAYWYLFPNERVRDAEAERPEGPWTRARKIVTHRDYTFYNTVHHPLFDQEGGRAIYFEGTYTDAFSNAKEKTPRYDYNQVMYRLRLDDPRLQAVQK